MLSPDQFKTLVKKDRELGYNVSHAKPPGKSKTDAGFAKPYEGKRRKEK